MRIAFALLALSTAGPALGQFTNLWTASYNGGGLSDDEPSSVAVDERGDIYVSGWSKGVHTYSFQYWTTIKYSAEGRRLWVDYLSLPGYDRGGKALLDADGNWIASVSVSTNWVLLKYSPQGRQTLAQVQGEVACDLAVDSAGGIYLTGTIWPGSGERHIGVFKYAADGRLLWRREYQSAPEQRDVPQALFIDPAANLYVAGSADAAGQSRVLILKYDASGNLLWDRQYDRTTNNTAPRYTAAYAITGDAEGNVYVAGSSGAYNLQDNRYLTLKYDGVGNHLWTREHESSGAPYDQPLAIKIDLSGNVVISGKPFTIKYSAAGEPIWVSRSEGLQISCEQDGSLMLLGSYTRYQPGVIQLDRVGNQIMSGPPAQAGAIGLSNSFCLAFATDARGFEECYYDYDFNRYLCSSTGTTDFGTALYQLIDSGDLPTVIFQTQPRSVFPADTVSLKVEVQSSLALNFQWLFNGISIPGAISSSLTLSNVQPANQGGYSVRVMSASGSILSPEAQLIVLPDPFRFTSFSGDGVMNFANAFSNGIITVEKVSALSGPPLPWWPEKNVFSTGSLAQMRIISPDANAFYRALALDLSDGRAGFTNLVESYSTLSTIAGGGGTPASTNKWLPGFENGPATSALLSRPHIAMSDDAGNIFIADKDAHGIRKVRTDGTIITVAGTYAAGDGYDGPAPGTEVALNEPNGLWVRGDGTVYILDLMNGKIRRLDTNGIMTLLFAVPGGIASGRGLWVSDDESVAYVCSGDSVKKWTATDGVTDFATGFSQLGNLAFDPAGELVVTDRGGHAVYRLESDGIKTRIAGNETTSHSAGGGDGGLALLTGLNQVRAICFLPTGAYLLGTDAGSQIWYVDVEGKIHLFLHGNATAHAGDGPWFYNPGQPRVSKVRQITSTRDGDLLITEHDSGYVRKVRFLRFIAGQ